MIPGLQNANFVKYGVMHRNTYINAPEVLDETYNMKKNRKIFFAGQITGVEGYVESIASGFVAGINAVLLYQLYNNNSENIEAEYDRKKSTYDNQTVIGALANYIAAENENFQPMNANFGILPPLEINIKDKKERYGKMAERSLNKIKEKYKN